MAKRQYQCLMHFISLKVVKNALFLFIKETYMSKDLEFSDKYVDAHKKFKTTFKKGKKQLIKDAKEFQCFDFYYTEKVLFDMLKLNYEFYSNPALLFQDTNSDYNNYEESIKALGRVVEIINMLEREYLDINECLELLENEHKLKKELYNLIGEYWSSWWD